MVKSIRFTISFTFFSVLVLGGSCKKNQDSEVSATTKIKGAALDLTKYDDATTKEYENMKKEVDAKWPQYPYSYFEEIGISPG